MSFFKANSNSDLGKVPHHKYLGGYENMSGVYEDLDCKNVTFDSDPYTWSICKANAGVDTVKNILPAFGGKTSTTPSGTTASTTTAGGGPLQTATVATKTNYLPWIIGIGAVGAIGYFAFGKKKKGRK